MQSPYDPTRMLNGRFVVVASPAGVGQEQSYAPSGVLCFDEASDPRSIFVGNASRGLPPAFLRA